jgi:glucokinase
VAETRLGAGVGHAHVLFMPLGTGIAGALLLDGTVVVGDGFAGELGHVVVDPDGPPCPCGQRGCLEVLASASALERAYAAASGTRLPAEVVAERAASGEPTAAAAWSRVVSSLGRALATVVTLTGVELVLVGGGLAQSGEQLLAPLRQDLSDRLTFQRMPQVQRAALGDRAGSLGAACLAWDAL